MELFMPYIQDFLLSLVKLIGGGLMLFLLHFLRRILTVEQMKSIQSLAKVAVQFAEQTGMKEYGHAKFNLATSKLVRMAREKGIELTQEEIEGYIESAVNEMNIAKDLYWKKHCEHHEP